MSMGMPPSYVGAPLIQPSVGAGTCLLTPNETMIRPIIGGKRHKKTKKNKNKKSRKGKMKGGFLPSIGEPFVAAAGKYIAPLALFGLYRFLKNKPTKLTRKTRR